MARLAGFVVVLAAVFCAAVFRPPGIHVRLRLEDDTVKDTLLEKFPFSPVLKTLKSGHKVRIPYHAFGAHATVVYGGIDLAAATAVVKKGTPGTGLVPIRTTDGRGLAGLYLVNYPSTGVGAYLEVVVTILVAPEDKASVPCASDSPHCGSYALYLHDGAVSFSYKLWLDQEAPVAYGRELLGTDKYLSKNMKVDNNADGSVDVIVPGVIEAKIQPQSPVSTLLNVLPGLLFTAGVAPTLRLLTATPFFSMILVNPIGVAEGFDDRAPSVQGIIANDPSATINPWTSKDSISLKGDLAQFKFTPASVQQSKNFRLAMLNPHN